MMRDLVPLQIKEIEELIELGVTWIQLDSLGYNRVIDRRFEAAMAARTARRRARPTSSARSPSTPSWSAPPSARTPT